MKYSTYFLTFLFTIMMWNTHYFTFFMNEGVEGLNYFLGQIFQHRQRQETNSSFKSKLTIVEEILLKGEGGFGTGGHMCPCDWLMSMYGKTHHNIVISFQLK